MESRDPRIEHLRSAVDLRRELGPEYEDALVESFLEKVAARSAPSFPVQAQPRDQAPLLAIWSLVLAIPLSGVAGLTAGLPGLITAWAAIVAVNLADALRRR